jgi:heat shock protein HslJ
MRIWLILALAFLAFGCERTDYPASTDSQQVLGNWRLVEPTSKFSTTLTIEVDQPSGGTISGIYSLKLTGKAAVNTYMATARLLNSETGSLDVDYAGSTKIGGSVEEMQFEKTYSANLDAVNRYEITDKLRLYYEHAESGVLVYEKIK